MNFLTTYLEDVPNPVFIIRNGIIEYANESALKKSDADFLINTPFEQVIHVLKLPVSKSDFANLGHSWYKLKKSEMSHQNKEYQIIELLPRSDVPANNELDKWKDMIALMLHRFRSPLTGINGYLELLENENEGNKINKRIGSIQKGIDRLNSMMDELEVLYHIPHDPGTVELSPIYIEKVVQEVMVWFQQEQRNRFSVHENESLTEITSNSGILKELLKLLLLNALEHSEDPSIEVTISDGEGAMITIRNSGGPIPEEINSRIFDPFSTTKAINFGIGLTKAILFARQLGGTLFMEQEDEYIYFIVYLPIRS